MVVVPFWEYIETWRTFQVPVPFSLFHQERRPKGNKGARQEEDHWIRVVL